MTPSLLSCARNTGTSREGITCDSQCGLMSLTVMRSSVVSFAIIALKEVQRVILHHSLGYSLIYVLAAVADIPLLDIF